MTCSNLDSSTWGWEAGRGRNGFVLVLSNRTRSSLGIKNTEHGGTGQRDNVISTGSPLWRCLTQCQGTRITSTCPLAARDKSFPTGSSQCPYYHPKTCGLDTFPGRSQDAGSWDPSQSSGTNTPRLNGILRCFSCPHSRVPFQRKYAVPKEKIIIIKPSILPTLPVSPSSSPQTSVRELAALQSCLAHSLSKYPQP